MVFRGFVFLRHVVHFHGHDASTFRHSQVIFNLTSFFEELVTSVCVSQVRPRRAKILRFRDSMDRGQDIRNHPGPSRFRFPYRQDLRALGIGLLRTRVVFGLRQQLHEQVNDPFPVFF